MGSHHHEELSPKKAPPRGGNAEPLEYMTGGELLQSQDKIFALSTKNSRFVLDRTSGWLAFWLTGWSHAHRCVLAPTPIDEDIWRFSAESRIIITRHMALYVPQRTDNFHWDHHYPLPKEQKRV